MNITKVKESTQLLYPGIEQIKKLSQGKAFSICLKTVNSRANKKRYYVERSLYCCCC
jgi:hypothetical protein